MAENLQKIIFWTASKFTVSIKEKVYVGLLGAVVSIVAMLKLPALAVGGVLYITIRFIDYNILQQPVK